MWLHCEVLRSFYRLTRPAEPRDDDGDRLGSLNVIKRKRLADGVAQTPQNSRSPYRHALRDRRATSLSHFGALLLTVVLRIGLAVG
ncbi:Hypothetical protein A7982_00460 [Minicystis rosea]|nr:Hypothetical protein A7982_00460 [Minicystis rosea]